MMIPDFQVAGHENSKFVALARKSKRAQMANTVYNLALFGQAVLKEDAKKYNSHKLPPAKQAVVDELRDKFIELIRDVDESISVLALDEFLDYFLIDETK